VEIISHRGYWLTPEEQNTVAAFQRAIDHGFGIETDVRDFNKSLVISHDSPTDKCDAFDSLLCIARETEVMLAINVKSDGLSQDISKVMSGYPVNRWFVFDMSVPDMRWQLKSNNPTFGRISDIEPTLPNLLGIQGVWLDIFESDWWTAADLRELLEDYSVCVVSSELHKRDKSDLWEKLKPFSNNPRLSICTDFPMEAERFFNED